MAKKSKEGAEVRKAFDGPKVEYDDLMDHHDKWAREETDAASDAGSRRQQIGAFADKAGLENKALSQFRAGMKIKNEGKQRDWLRSMKVLIGHAETAIFGNQPDMIPDAPVQTKASGKAKATKDPEPTPDEDPMSNEPADAETEEFNAAVDAATGDDDHVVPFNPAAE